MKPTSDIEQLIEAAKRNRLSFARWKTSAKEIKITLPSAPAPIESRDAALVSEPAEKIVKSPMVGYFHPAKQNLGQPLKKGAVIAEIESLGLSNPVLADADGVLELFFLDDGDPVEYAQPIAKVRAK
jgi:acetyl-CoA carboxylase biotin carboxyl carrier protein